MFNKETEYVFRRVTFSDIRDFIEAHHYSKNVNGVTCSYAFALYLGDSTVGAALFGKTATDAWKKYGDKADDVLELRRLALLDDCPKNTESWFIAMCIREIKKDAKFKICVSYADPHHGHVGAVYQAANWNYEGQTAKNKIWRTPEGNCYHSKTMHNTYKGKYKPVAQRLQFLQIIGDLEEIQTPGKHIYTYNLAGKQKPNGKPYPKKHEYLLS